MILGDTFDFRAGLRSGAASLDTLNSLTKYPSIETYHKIGTKGVLMEYALPGSAHEVQAVDPPPVACFVGEVEVTEKVDGTNARVIILPNGMVIVGSREELLWATGDLIHNPTLGIVHELQLRGIPAAASAQLTAPDRIRVVYGELYGHGIGAAGRRYSGGTKDLIGFRVFDVASVPVAALVWSTEDASNWRKRGGQKYESAEVIKTTANALNAQRVPSLAVLDAQELPTSIEHTRAWLEFHASCTQVALVQQENGPTGAEGVVLRGWDAARSRLLAKVRFEDYDRTLREWSKKKL